MGKSLAKIITMARSRKKLTKAELSRRTGIAISYLTKIEQGERENLSFEFIVKLAYALDLELYNLSKMLYPEIDFEWTGVRKDLVDSINQEAKQPEEYKTKKQIVELINELEDYLKEKLKEINEFSKEEKNKSVFGAQMSLNTWWDEYIEKYKNVKESSKIIYKNNYDANIRNAFLGEKNISKITVTDIQNFINSLETYNRKKVSLRLLKELFDKAHKCGYLKKNVVELAEIKLKKPVDPNKKLNDDAKKVYTAEELKNIFKLLKTKNRMKYYFICKLALYTGCRVGEILALTWDDVKYDEGVIYITKQINQVTKNISDPKSPSSIRRVIIIEPLKKLLDELKDYYNPVNNQEYLVPDAPKANISSIISQLFNRLKINGNIHMFRHTFTSLLKANNIDDKCVQSLLGHESLSTTQDIYQHLTEDNAKKEFEKINKITFEFDN